MRTVPLPFQLDARKRQGTSQQKEKLHQHSGSRQLPVQRLIRVEPLQAPFRRSPNGAQLQKVSPVLRKSCPGFDSNQQLQRLSTFLLPR